MAETVLKFSPQQEAAPAARKRSLLGVVRARSRMILLVIVPMIALLVGLGFYLTGGRYISTDNAYVGAQKVLITPDISGKVSRVLVTEGQHVAAGDDLFEIDPTPFQLALRQAQSKLDSVRPTANVANTPRISPTAARRAPLLRTRRSTSAG